MSASNVVAIIFLILPFALGYALFGLWKERSRRKAMETRFKGVIAADAEVQSLGRQASDLRQDIDKIRDEYASKRATYN